MSCFSHDCNLYSDIYLKNIFPTSLCLTEYCSYLNIRFKRRKKTLREQLKKMHLSLAVSILEYTVSSQFMSYGRKSLCDK